MWYDLKKNKAPRHVTLSRDLKQLRKKHQEFEARTATSKFQIDTPLTTRDGIFERDEGIIGWPYN